MLRNFALHPKRMPGHTVRQRRLSWGTLLCRVSMPMCLAASVKQHAPFQCFPKRHALATAHNATTRSDAKYASQVSAIRECLYRKHMKSVAWCGFREGKVRLSANLFAWEPSAPAMKNEVLNGGEAHKSNIETAKQLVPSESCNVARRDQFFFYGCFHIFRAKNSPRIWMRSAKAKSIEG